VASSVAICRPAVCIADCIWLYTRPAVCLALFLLFDYTHGRPYMASRVYSQMQSTITRPAVCKLTAFGYTQPAVCIVYSVATVKWSTVNCGGGVRQIWFYNVRHRTAIGTIAFWYWFAVICGDVWTVWWLVVFRRTATVCDGNWTLRLLDRSPTRHFAYCLDSSPTDITHLILFYSGSLVGKMKSNL